MGQFASSDPLNKFVKGEDFVVQFDKCVPPPAEEGGKQIRSITCKLLNDSLDASYLLVSLPLFYLFSYFREF